MSDDPCEDVALLVGCFFIKFTLVRNVGGLTSLLFLFSVFIVINEVFTLEMIVDGSDDDEEDDDDEAANDVAAGVVV